MREGARKLLRAAMRAHGGLDEAAVAALHAEARALTEAEFLAACRALESDTREVKAARGTTAYRKVDRARRKLLLPVIRFNPMLIERLEAKADGEVDLAAADKRSLKRLVSALVDLFGAEAVIDAAQTLAREKSLAYDIA